MTAGTIEEFKAIVMMANRVAREFNDGDLNTCILTSYALAAALTDLGYADARPVRVEAASFPDDRELHCITLGPLPPRGRAEDGYCAGIWRSALGRAGCLIRLSIKVTTSTDGLMLALASSRWQRPSHLNFGISICGRTSVCNGCISLACPRAICWRRRRVSRGPMLRAHCIGARWRRKSATQYAGWSKHISPERARGRLRVVNSLRSSLPKLDIATVIVRNAPCSCRHIGCVGRLRRERPRCGAV
jgi:hypothetical protein